ncbi:MAG: hypothetical protein AAGD34_17595 [Pseudomonadota bacterium]
MTTTSDLPDNEPAAETLSPAAEAERKRRQRSRSIAIALILVAVVGIFYAITIVQIGGTIGTRPL